MIRNKAFAVLILLLLLSMAAFVSTPANNAANAGSTDPTNNLALVCAPVPTDIGAAVDVFAALAAIEINGHSLISSNHRSDVPNLGATWVPEVAFPLVCHLDTTNNLDADGIMHLTRFLMEYPKTCLVISHDANFLNAFTQGVLYLDSYTHKVEQYLGDYYDVLTEIEAQIERERAKNAQLKKSIQDKKDKVNFFAHKGGKMRKLASKLKEQVEEDEENMVDERKEDKTIRDFILPAQTDYVTPAVEIHSVGVMINHEPTRKTLSQPIQLRKKQKLLIQGPNGIGKSTFLRALALGEESGATIAPEVKVGYYRQDFSGLDFDRTAYQALEEMMVEPYNQEIYAAAAQFLLNSEILKNKVGSLSEGQKGLLCYARFYLQKPGLLILDEPTNHINFRHLPVIAKALNEFQGAIILVSHAYEFVDQIQIDQTLDLGAL